MHIPLLGFLLLATPWAGSWKLELEGSREFMHLVVRDETTVELYDDAWTPHDILKVQIDDSKAEIRALILGSAQLITIKIQRNEDRCDGSISLKYPQFPITKSCMGKKVSNELFPAPVDWIARNRTNGRIDVIEYCAEKAPRDDFESFVRFWEKDVESSFYIFLHQIMAQIQEQGTKTQLLREVFSNLDSNSSECVEGALENRGKSLQEPPVSQRPTGTSASPSEDKPDCLVLIPAITAKETRLRLSSIKNDVPPGVKPCCGESLYDMEDFLLLPIKCDNPTDEEEAPECSSDETSGPSITRDEKRLVKQPVGQHP